ncbi:MAG: MATE family efflux transporter [Oscillospiraceae bacterium]|nr:MATE family efflux transporter [Oscillospiraceae bacterium]
MEKIHNFTEGKILGPLLKFASPIFLALFLQAMYGAADLIIVGQFAQTADVSAVSTGSLIMQSLTVTFASLSMGVTILLGQKIGEKKVEEAGKAIGSAIVLFSIIAVVFTAVFVAGARPISQIMKAPADAMEQTVSYLAICSGGIIFIVAFNTLSAVFKGLGDSKVPLITVAIACVVNIFLDLLLVAKLGMGAAGAAYATVTAQAVSVIVSLVIIIVRKVDIPFTVKNIRWNKLYISRILKFGVPVALQDLLVSISFLVITAIINSIGLEQSAGVGVAEKVCVFLMLIPSAYMQSLSAFVAQNIGANKIKRARKALLYAVCTSLPVVIIMAYLAIFHGSLLASVFDNDATVVQMAADYLKAYGIDCLLTAELFCLNGYYSGMGKTKFVMIQGIIGAFCVRIPVSYFVSKIPGATLFHIGLATPASTVLQLIICGVFFVYLLKKEKKNSMLPASL